MKHHLQDGALIETPPPPPPPGHVIVYAARWAFRPTMRSTSARSLEDRKEVTRVPARRVFVALRKIAPQSASVRVLGDGPEGGLAQAIHSLPGAAAGSSDQLLRDLREFAAEQLFGHRKGASRRDEDRVDWWRRQTAARWSGRDR